MWVSEGGWGGCFTAASGPLSPEHRRLMVVCRSRTGKLGGSSAAHEAEPLAFIRFGCADGTVTEDVLDRWQTNAVSITS